MDKEELHEAVSEAKQMVAAGTFVPSEETTLEPVKPETKIELYTGIATHEFTDEQCKILMKEVPSEYIDLRPDGLIYMPEIRYRFILNTVFGPGQWALMRVQDPMFYDNKVGYHGALFIGGKFLGESIGEQEYHSNNPIMSKFTAIESAKSDCITRCCKDLGIAWNLWNPKFVKKWKVDNAVEVWCFNDKTKKNKKLWRLKTDKPIDVWPWKEKKSNGDKGDPPPEPGDKTNGEGTRIAETEMAVKIKAEIGKLVSRISPPEATNEEKIEKSVEILIEHSTWKDTCAKSTEDLKKFSLKRLQTIYGKIKKELDSMGSISEANQQDLL